MEYRQGIFNFNRYLEKKLYNVAPKGLFPPEPKRYKGPKLKVAIIGAGLAGMSTAVELLDQGHEVDIYESRTFIGGKVGSFVDRRGNHIEMGLHVFFGCYNNLFRLMKKVGAEKNLLVKDHTHTFVNEGGEVGELDFRFPVGAPLHGIQAFLTTNQLPISFSDWFLSKGGTRASIQRMWDPVAYALGFIDCDNISARCMLTIFSLFATKTEASLLRMLKGSPDAYLSGPIRKYIEEKGGRFHLRWGCRKILYDQSPDGETYVTGIAMLLPAEWRDLEIFNNIYKLEGVPVVTVQLRYNGWVTELRDLQQSRQLNQAAGLDNLLYTPDADFFLFCRSCSNITRRLLHCRARVTPPVVKLFPSSRGLDVVWSSVVKIGQSLYREAPGKDPFRPDQKTPVKNFFLAGSYTKQDYIDSMEGATLSGRQASAYICDAGEELFTLSEKLPTLESLEPSKSSSELRYTSPESPKGLAGIMA
ncbi:Zeta-carotene desaturase chloroplastic/chromoplastic [Bienertia sinuspersici]